MGCCGCCKCFEYGVLTDQTGSAINLDKDFVDMDIESDDAETATLLVTAQPAPMTKTHKLKQKIKV